MKKTLLLLSIFMIVSSILLNAQCPTGEINIKISVKTDNYGSETKWFLNHESGTPTYDSGGPYTDITGGQLYVKNVCVPEGTPVVFRIEDSFGDGICCSYGNGYYTVEMLGFTVASGGNFGTYEETFFIVDTPLVRDMSVLKLNMMDYFSVGNVAISGSVRSLGSDTVTSYDINYAINNGVAVTHNVTNQTIPPFESANFTHPVPFNATTSGSYTVKVWASNINGDNDLYNNNDTITSSFVVVSQAPEKYVLIEQATGAWCGYCPDGSVKLAQILATNPNAIGVAIHNGDAMAFPDGNTVNSAYASGYPNGYVDRFVFSDGSGVGLSRSLWSAKANERMSHISPVAVNVTNTYNSNTRVVNITVSATFYADLNEELRFNAYIVEDSLSGTGTGWNQANNYNSTSGHPMQGMGNPIIGYQHRHVVKAMLGGPFGQSNSIPASVTDGNTYTKEFTYTLPAGMKEKDVSIIGMVQKYDSNTKNRAILNSKEVHLDGFSFVAPFDFVKKLIIYPNPASEQTNILLNISESKNVNIKLFNILGQNIYNEDLGLINAGYYQHVINVQSLTKGLYQLMITFDNYSTSNKIIIE